MTKDIAPTSADVGVEAVVVVQQGMSGNAVLESASQPIAYSVVIYHGCRSLSCFAPRHLQAVTYEENLRRDVQLGAPTKRGPTPAEELGIAGGVRFYWSGPGSPVRIVYEGVLMPIDLLEERPAADLDEARQQVAEFHAGVRNASPGDFTRVSLDDSEVDLLQEALTFYELEGAA